MLYVLIAYYVVVFCFLIPASYPTRLEKHRLLFKVLTSLGFLAIATYCAATSGHLAFFWWMLPGFIFCFVGDIFMALTDNKWNDTIFLIGVAAFAIAHIAFLVALSRQFPFTPFELIIPVIAVVMTVCLDRLPKMELGKLKYCTFAYAFLVSWLFSKALLWLIMAGASTVTLLFAFGALLFFSSDLLLLFIYFYADKFKPLRFLNQITYYGGMGLLAIALLFV